MVAVDVIGQLAQLLPYHSCAGVKGRDFKFAISRKKPSRQESHSGMVRKTYWRSADRCSAGLATKFRLFVGLGLCATAT